MIELVEQLKSELQNKKEVKFKFTKIDGTERIALGTKHKDVIESFNATPSGNGVEKTGVITYFDLEKKSWRSFKEENLKEIL